MDKRKSEESRLSRNKGPISLERAFVTVAKRLLNEETYNMLMEEAKFLAEDSKAGAIGTEPRHDPRTGPSRPTR